MNNISIVVYDNLNGRSTKLFSVESNKKSTLERDISEMILALEKKINLNPMLISKYITVTKNRHHVLVEMMDFIAHPEDYIKNDQVENIKEVKELSQNTIIGSD